MICDGCNYAMYMNEEGPDDLCAFCRRPSPTLDEQIKQLINLMDNGNAEALNQLGTSYDDGTLGLPQDIVKAHKLYLKAGELGSGTAYYNLGHAYRRGDGVEVDQKKAKHYYELAAMNGCVEARYNLGVFEWNAINNRRAMKHFMIAAKAGHEMSVGKVKEGFHRMLLTKDEYEGTLQAYKKSHDEIHNEMRDKALSARMRLSL